MRNLISFVAIAIFLPLLAPAQAKYKIVILGSSSAYGVGASTPDSSWAGRTKAYYKARNQLDTIINLAVPGSFSDSGVKLLPKALGYSPDIVLVAFPSNDLVADVGIPRYMSNLRKIYNTVTAAGIRCFVSTTQPRDDKYAEPLLKVGRDSIMMEFPYNYLQFYDPLVAPGSLDINPIYSAEGIHPNNAGHRLLFQSILAAQIIPSIPPATSLAIEKVYIAGLDIATTIDIPRDESFYLAIFNTGGVPVQRRSVSGRAPAVTLDIPLSSLPAGVYYLQITTPDGQRARKAFTVL
jgi:lysophospholipase L1-like esterase